MSDVTWDGVTCALCGEYIVSTYRHDFVTCGCGHTFVDGGSAYLRTGTLNAGPPPIFGRPPKEDTP